MHFQKCHPKLHCYRSLVKKDGFKQPQV